MGGVSTLHVSPRVQTARLLLRPWRGGDAPRLKAAIDANLDHLRAWMPWAMDEPSSVEVIAERIERFAAAFDSGEDWTFGIFSPDEAAVLGGAGLHRRVGPGGLEIGYWLARTESRKGYATETARALTNVAFAEASIAFVEIRCDPNNTASAAVPRRLGFRHVLTLQANTLTPAGLARDTMVWRTTRHEFHRHAESRGQ